MQILDKHEQLQDVIIIGGSYAGLSAAMALGRSLRNVLIIDSGKPCNIQTPHSHNFITHDGETPAAISLEARKQVLNYPTVKLIDDLALAVVRQGEIFQVTTSKGLVCTARKILFSTGMRDIMPNIPGMAECWGISVLPCPYCHGYEVKGKKTGLFGNGDVAFHVAMLLKQLSSDLVIYTNGPADFRQEQLDKFQKNAIPIIESPIQHLEHEDGYMHNVVLSTGETHHLEVMYAKVTMEQHCHIPSVLGCEIDDFGFIKVNEMQKTSIDGIYAAGDNTTMGRSLSIAIGAGTKAGAAMNGEMCMQDF